MSEKTNRNSSIELMKVIAIVMIILSHSMPDGDGSLGASYIDIDSVTTNWQLLLAGLFKNMGQIGNDIFLVASCWFLVDSKQAKRSKLAGFLADSWFCSILMLIVFLALGYSFSLKYIVKQFFPATFNNCWFLTCFILFYMIHPLLHVALESMSQKSLLRFNIMFFIMYNCMGFIMGNTMFYFSELIGFCGFYFLVGYIKKYASELYMNKGLNIKILMAGIVLWLVSFAATDFLGFKVGMLSDQLMRWDTIMNPCFVLIGIGAFGLAHTGEFYNSFINYISSLSLIIYMLHANIIIRQYGRWDLFAWIKANYGYDKLILWIFAYAVVNVVMSVFLATIYDRTVRRLFHRGFEFIVEKI
ncbi:acyltransferase family protein [Pseudobutyrivibrio ruminis]|uniref:Acyltransferase 3 domain-containing protein n=1 Tax=Pseudobutyrivibrio ruminis TaxID=46206 RepID=A0A2G3DTT4_9FIRM|nr:acyltransferase [Pseudobutyrivibrio ruminis]PHU34394.1 hypothetical protein CSX01_10395 [Pseudobutyrivibrio ruminis]